MQPQYQGQPPAQQQGMYQQQPPMGQQQGMYQQQPPMGQQQGMYQQQPLMGQPGMYQQAPMNPGGEPTCACGQKVSCGAITAAVINILFFLLFALMAVLENWSFKIGYLAAHQQFIPPSYSHPILDGSYPVMGVFILLIVPNCFVFCVKKAWAAYLWIGTNAAAYLLLLIWIIVVQTSPAAPWPNEMFDKVFIGTYGEILIFGSLDIWFTVIMLRYAKFLNGQARDPRGGMAFEPPPGETPSGQVEPVPSHYSQSQPPPYNAAQA